MDVIKDMAKQFAYGIRLKAASLEKFDRELTSNLLYITKKSEILRFLSYLKDMVETSYQQHAKVCKDPDRCGENKAYEIALYGIKQQYDEYYVNEGGTVTNEVHAMQFFSEGQYFDAFTAIRECIKDSKYSITLIDNYVDEDTLAFFPSKEPKIKLQIITKSKSLNGSFERAVELYNKQYENLKIFTSDNYHDRFLIIDDRTFYHIGASIKDAGNKTFMFSIIEDEDIKQLLRNKLRQDFIGAFT